MADGNQKQLPLSHLGSSQQVQILFRVQITYFFLYRQQTVYLAHFCTAPAVSVCFVLKLYHKCFLSFQEKQRMELTTSEKI